MQIYLVGGAVRDQSLGLPVKERDWVVVGATPEQLIEQGYQPVGKDFPVFLHPDTHEEYALARTERKSGRGYAGFTFDTDVAVTLEQDLLRRDLTINAMAQDAKGRIIDPYHGKQDLYARVLRHVSNAFVEDPVRVLRVARFAARFAHLKFTVAPATLKLMQQMVANEEVNYLVAERVWQEVQKALQAPTPSEFFKVLQTCGALSVIFPEMQSLPYLSAIDAADADAPWIRFAVLVGSLSEKELAELTKRLRVPKQYAELATLTSRWHKCLVNIHEFSADALVDLLVRGDGVRRKQRFQEFLKASQYIWQSQGVDVSAGCKLLQQTLTAILDIDTQALQQQDLVGPEFAAALKQLRIAAVKRLL